MKKIIGLMAAVAMLVGMLAMPASADPDETGTFTGTAAVGKQGTCAQDGTGTVSGAGLGLPGLAENGKTGYWTLNTNITGLLHGGTGVLRACGLLGPVGETGIGAHCGISRGHSGKGTVSIGGVDHIHLLNLGWISSAGGTLPVTGNTAPANSKDKNGTVVAVVQAQGGDACLTKSPPGDDPKTGGATSFTVAGTFESTSAHTAEKHN